MRERDGGQGRGALALVAAPERAEPIPLLLLTAGAGCVYAQVSRDAPTAPLPGGYRVGEKVFYIGASMTFDNYVDKLVHGQQGEVVLRAGNEGKVDVLFPGNKRSVGCSLANVCRLRAAPALPTPLVTALPRQPLCPAAPTSQSQAHAAARAARSPTPTAPECGRVCGGGKCPLWKRQRGRLPSATSLLLTAGGCVRR